MSGCFGSSNWILRKKIGEADAVAEEKPKHEEHKGRKKKPHLHKIITTRAKDGSFGHEHVYKDHPDAESSHAPVFAGTSRDMDDLHAHMDDHFGGAPAAGGEEPVPEAAAGGAPAPGGEPQPA